VRSLQARSSIRPRRASAHSPTTKQLRVMPKYAYGETCVWRSRRAAIGKKSEMDFELLMESELAVVEMKPSKPRRSQTTSPITVGSTQPPSSPTSIFSANLIADVPEMKPLPGVWVTVGKGGRPTKSIMYEDPTMAAPKRKKRVRARKAPEDDEDEYPPVPECSLEPTRRSQQQLKEVMRAKEVKQWSRYRHTKELKIVAHEHLLAALAEGGMLVDLSDDRSETLAVAKQSKVLKVRNDKGSSLAAKARRKARNASAAARCFAVVDPDEEALGPGRVEMKPRWSFNDGWEEVDAAEPEAMAAGGPSAKGKRCAGASSAAEEGIDAPPMKRSAASGDKRRKASSSAERCNVM